MNYFEPTMMIIWNANLRDFNKFCAVPSMKRTRQTTATLFKFRLEVSHGYALTAVLVLALTPLQFGLPGLSRHAGATSL
jgi:hypothetical protein